MNRYTLTDREIKSAKKNGFVAAVYDRETGAIKRFYKKYSAADAAVEKKGNLRALALDGLAQ